MADHQQKRGTITPLVDDPYLSKMTDITGPSSFQGGGRGVSPPAAGSVLGRKHSWLQ